MVNLNLLDPVLQQQLNRERILVLLRDTAALTFVAIAIIGILLSISRAVLVGDLRDTLIRANIISSRNQPVMKSIQELNAALKLLDKVSEEYTPWSRWLAAFTQTVAPGNTLSAISIDREQNIIKVTGLSQRRDNLLEFKTRLEASGLVKEIEFPLSNLLSKENVEFEFSAALNPEIYHDLY